MQQRDDVSKHKNIHVIVKAATAKQMRKRMHTVAKPVSGEHDRIDVTQASQHRVAARKRGRTVIHSEHYVYRSCNQDMLRAQEGASTHKEEKGGSAETTTAAAKATVPNVNRVNSEGSARQAKRCRGGTDERHTREDRRQSNASARVMRSTNTILKRKLHNLERKMQCVGSLKCWDAHQATKGDSSEPDNKRQHRTTRDTRTGHADETGGSSKRHRKHEYDVKEAERERS